MVCAALATPRLGPESPQYVAKPWRYGEPLIARLGFEHIMGVTGEAVRACSCCGHAEDGASRCNLLHRTAGMDAKAGRRPLITLRRAIGERIPAGAVRTL